jgi:hypothetical protein
MKPCKEDLDMGYIYLWSHNVHDLKDTLAMECGFVALHYIC